MKKTLLGTSLALGTVLALTACGGGSSDPVATGKAFYLDSAVSGVNYKCGTQESITRANGEFTFDVGSGCTFYLGDIKLRDMDKTLLKDGAKIVEEDENIAALLQSLDADGNPENGITIKEDVVKTLSTALNENGGSIPKTEEALEAAIAALGEVEGYHGHIRSNEEVKTHLMQTQATVLKALIAGKEFYLLYNDDTNTWGTINIKFNADATSSTIIDSEGEEETGSSKIKGNKLYVDGKEYLTFKKTTAKYLEFKSSKSQEIVKFYFHKADAEADAATLTEEHPTPIQNEEDNPSSQSNTNPCHVEGNTVSANEGQTCNYQNHTVACQSGRVTLDGMISGLNVNMNGTKFTCTK